MRQILYLIIFFVAHNYAMENVACKEFELLSDPRNFFVDAQGNALTDDSSLALPFDPDGFKDAIKLLCAAESEKQRKQLASNAIFHADPANPDVVGRVLACKSLNISIEPGLNFFYDDYGRRGQEIMNRLRVLHACGYDVAQLRNAAGQTILHVNFDPKIIKFLLACGANIDEPCNNGITPFGTHLPCGRGEARAEQFILCGASGLMNAKKGTSMWHEVSASSLSKGYYTYWIIDFPAVQSTRFDKKGNSAFHALAKRAEGGWPQFWTKKESCAVLALFYENINKANNKGITPLMILKRKEFSTHPLYELITNNQALADAIMDRVLYLLNRESEYHQIEGNEDDPEFWRPYFCKRICQTHEKATGKKTSLFKCLQDRETNGNRLRIHSHI